MSRNQDRLFGENKPEDTSPPAQNNSGGGDLFSFVVPSEFVVLPSKGRFYPEGHPLHNQELLEIKQMTAKEEDILTSETLIKNGIVIDRLVGSIIKDKKIDPSSLLVGDRSAIVLTARKTGYGNIYDTSINCPSCGEKNSFSFDLNDSVLDHGEIPEGCSDLGNGKFEIVLPRTKIKVVVKMLNGYDEVEMSKEAAKRKGRNKSENQVSSQLKKIIYSVNGNTEHRVIDYFVTNVPSIETKFLRDTYVKLTPKIEMKTDFTCESCSFTDELEVPLNTEFFWPK